MKEGSLVKFPCDHLGYHIKTGLLLGFKDNPSDASVWELHHKYGGTLPGYCKDGPRQVAEVLFEGRVYSCWKHNVKPISSSRDPVSPHLVTKLQENTNGY